MTYGAGDATIAAAARIEIRKRKGRDVMAGRKHHETERRGNSTIGLGRSGMKVPEHFGSMDVSCKQDR
jgi:hypothetical protein